MSVPREIARALLKRIGWRRGTTADDGLCHPADSAAHPRPQISTRPLIGVIAVLLGSIISTLDSRITTFGLADRARRRSCGVR